MTAISIDIVSKVTWASVLDFEVIVVLFNRFDESFIWVLRHVIFTEHILHTQITICVGKHDVTDGV